MSDAMQLVDEIQPLDDISTSKEHLDEWVLEMEALLDNRDISHATRPSKKIEKRPSIFGSWQCWDDFGASFIPETQKWQFVACITHWFGLKLRSYLEYMQEKEDLAWSYYRGVDEKFRAENSKHFIEHLLVHSCFLIFAMVLLSGEEYREVIVDKINDQSSFPKGLTAKDIQNLVYFLEEGRTRAKCYMLTMNYQIPWFVVEAVYTELSNLSKLFVPPIHKIVVSCFDKLCPREHLSKKDGGTVPEGGFKHLLHIFHWSRTPDEKYLVDTTRSTKSISRFHIPSATNLRLSQTVFVKDEGGSIDVSYCDGTLSGVMQLTPWHLFQYIPKLYESLLRFEGAYVGLGKPFTVYVACMSCLLKTEVDVRVLRENGVIPSTPFDDKDVLRCVQELKTFIPNGLRIPNELIILEEKVIAHYQRSAYRIYGEFKRRYCSNPWITISVIAGICLFVLTFIQTVLSFIQTKYSVLSYETQNLS